LLVFTIADVHHCWCSPLLMFTIADVHHCKCTPFYGHASKTAEKFNSHNM